MKIYRFLIILLLSIPITVFAENTIRERVYIQTDKQTYLAGELLWMKFYLTNESGLPSSFSKIGYVELVDETDAQVQVKLDITNGVASGWMELPVTLSTGNYRLIAYTTNMRNEGETAFFNKTISIINTFKSEASVKVKSASKNVDTEGLNDVSNDDAENVFLDAGTFQQSNISIETDNQTYPLRSKSEIRIKDLPENIHSLSISVAGRDLVQNNESILKWNDDLKGIANLPVKSDFMAEYEGHIINGTIIDVETNQRAADERINSILGFIGDQIRLFGGMTDNNSNIRFFTKKIKGKHEIAVSTVSVSEKKYAVAIETPFTPHSPKNIPGFLLNTEWEEQLLQRSVGMQVQYAYMMDSMSRVDTTYSFFRWKPDRSYILDEYTRFTTMEEIIIEFIPAVRFMQFDNRSFLSVLLNENGAFSSGSTLVLLDGIPIMNHKHIINYNPLLVYKIDVYKDKFVFGNKHYEGMVSLTTYKHDYPGLVTDESTHIFDYEGTQVHRYFYSPSYAEGTNVDSKIPDYRHTLLWMPDIETDGLQTLSVPFSTSDLTGDFQVTVEGISKDGKMFRGTSFFKVENP